MKKTDNTVLKNLLNLKEDYNLDLSEDKKDDQLILEDEADKEETNDTEASTEKNDTENKEKKPEEVNKKIADTNKENSKIEYKIDINPIYSKMQSAKSPTDVASVLKEFLDTVEASSLEALSQKKD